MMPHETSRPDLLNSKMLALSFYYPPLVAARAIQVARLLKHTRLLTVLVCADEEGARKDATQDPLAESYPEQCLRVPFRTSARRRQLNRAAYHFYRPLWGRLNKVPDQFAHWKSPVLRAVKNFVRQHRYQPDLLVTFGQPMTDHLIGLELKRLYQWSWVAHFSDPWVDNPFADYSMTPAIRRRNLSLERKVIEAADRLIFTSQETVELVLAKYPAAWKAKARVLPQSFDPELFTDGPEEDADAPLTVRYLGEFYGHRTPEPLLRALQSIANENPEILSKVRFELIGIEDPSIIKPAWLEGLPAGLFTLQSPVAYLESLKRMASADGLLVIDAPADLSVFLPSKLIDYIGAGRPILGLTPPGTAATLINQLGGWIAHPADHLMVKKVLLDFLSFLRRRQHNRQTWGEPSIRDRYEASQVAQSFADILQELLT
jgi:hypothetical protein